MQEEQQLKASAGALLVLVLAGPAAAQVDLWTLGFEGPSLITGAPGTTERERYYATLRHTGGGENAQGWTYGVAAEGAVIVGMTTDGTPLEGIGLAGGLDVTELAPPELNGGVGGGVSAIIVNLRKGTALPPRTLQRVAALTLEVTIPPASSSTRLHYQAGLRGSAAPMPIVITQGTESRTPTLGTREIGLQAAASCCEAWGIYGFSAARVTGAPPFAGILDAHPDFCLGRGGRIVHEVPPGEKGAATVWGNIIANIPPGNGGVQGWSYALAAEGPATVLSATIGGTFAEIAHDGGFDVTEVIAPFRSPTGTVLVVSAVVLHLKKGATLPQVGTESILRMEIETEQPMGRSERILGFRMTSGCCTGEPIPNLLTIAGDSHAICNEFAVDVDVVFRPQPAFRRGDANDQGTVDIADAIWILQDLHGDGPGTPCWDAGDANDDGRFDISDAIYLLNHLFLGARPPPPPFGECGLDPTPDALPCETRC